VKLAAEQRRHIYLILKEAVHNAARHAGAKSVKLRMAVADHRLLAEVQDDGRGFSPDGAPTDGYGVQSMRARAAQISGELSIHSVPGEGTRISLQVAL
jgi:signal transduction histidine kinase